jgi:RimJ/RimL family protein N-acetyltransferase
VGRPPGRGRDLARGDRREPLELRRGGHGLWALGDAQGFVGTCGLRPTGDGQVEVLYSIEPARWGAGLATEAARAVVGHAFATLGLTRVLGGVDDANHASRRVLEKLGMTPHAVAGGGPAGVGWLAVERARWRPTSA